jgi:hypothetical protein
LTLRIRQFASEGTSALIGGIIWGVGQALFEQSETELGRSLYRGTPIRHVRRARDPGGEGSRRWCIGQSVIAFADFHRLPGDTPQRDGDLNAGEINTAVELPPDGFSKNYTYLKIRDRLSYAFALISVAV